MATFITIVVAFAAFLAGTILDMGSYYCFKGQTLHKYPVFSGVFYAVVSIVCYAACVSLVAILLG